MLGEEPGDWQRGFGGSKSDRAPLGGGKDWTERLEGVGDGAAGNEGKGNGQQGQAQAASSSLRPVWRSGKFRG